MFTPTFDIQSWNLIKCLKHQVFPIINSSSWAQNSQIYITIRQQWVLMRDPVLFLREHRAEPQQSHFVTPPPQLGEDRLLTGGWVCAGPTTTQMSQSFRSSISADEVQNQVFNLFQVLIPSPHLHDLTREASVQGNWETQCVEPLIWKKKRSHLCSLNKIPQAYLWKLTHWHLSIDHPLIQLS